MLLESALPKSEFRFMSLSGIFQSNARRHLLQAKKHLDSGNIEFAWGSLSKAVKNYRKMPENWLKGAIYEHLQQHLCPVDSLVQIRQRFF